MRVGDLVTLRWSEGKRVAGMVVAGQESHGEVYVEWFSARAAPTWVRIDNLELVNELSSR
jgi:hypothetical protein